MIRDQRPATSIQLNTSHGETTQGGRVFTPLWSGTRNQQPETSPTLAPENNSGGGKGLYLCMTLGTYNQQPHHTWQRPERSLTSTSRLCSVCIAADWLRTVHGSVLPVPRARQWAAVVLTSVDMDTSTSKHIKSPLLYPKEKGLCLSKDQLMFYILLKAIF